VCCVKIQNDNYAGMEGAGKSKEKWGRAENNKSLFAIFCHCIIILAFFGIKYVENFKMLLTIKNTSKVFEEGYGEKAFSKKFLPEKSSP